MRTSPLVAQLEGAVAASLSDLPGASSEPLREIRQSALKRFAETGLPRITDENWKYTNIRPMDRIAFELSLPPAHSLRIDELQKSIEFLSDAYRVVLLNGWFSQSACVLDNLPQGVEIRSLADILKTPTKSKVVDFSLQQLKRKAQQAADGFAAFSAGMAGDGVVIYLDSGVKLDKPIEIVYVTDSDANEKICNVNSFVHVQCGAHVQIIERFVSLDSTNHLTTASVAVQLDEQAQCDHYRIQNESQKAFHIGSANVNQAASSRYRIYSLSFGALLSRHEITQSLNGVESHCELKGLALGDGKQHIDNFTTISHASANASSDEFYKCILDGNSRSVFHGRVIVHKDAQHTDAQQQNRNLLLSPNAEADTKPQLEIYADDVKCSHGATVGQLDEDSVFYLRTRGLDEASARQMLTEAFALEIVEQIELDGLKQQIMVLVEEKLHPNAKDEVVS